MNQRKKSVILAMSGGVDSSVAAGLLLREGYDVTGVFLCMGVAAGEAEGSDRACCKPEDAADARRVANHFDIPLHVLNLREEFSRIIDDFVAEYAAGRTPNPCVHCNTLLKFGRFVELADSLGVEFVATGHHARRAERNGKPVITRAADLAKDQSYALFGVATQNVGRILLPIGELPDKQAVRNLAEEFGLDVHDKPDSQEICFVPDDDYTALLAARAPEALKPGRILNTAGEELGRHDGYGRFTIGQRRGLKVAAGVPMYVTRIDPDSGDVTLGTREEACSRRLRADGANWHVPPEKSQFDAVVQIRYNHRGAPARVKILDEQSFTVEFREPVHAITPGQAAVVYENDTVLGGGWIT
ncbi:MAG: tRNA 2-thiouridine(34) synthase MnmA [Phycisphaerae bacterium]|nr:tRNA 2-thiouridine(34) synthase MnmA [Phycisphaerae bacterium]